ncbi:MAG TPA: serine hydrolase domain-containing protein [Acidimicrobiia bacterium]|nr:serine hydrolase domain-containing protein [Acidimicrobiia bacterium]
MRAGLPAGGRDWGPTDPDALSRFATSDIAHHRLHANPGEIGRYSSTAISLVGLALQELSGVSFPELLRSEILDPAGMSMTVYPSEADSGTVSWPHSRAGSGWVPVPRLADNPAGYPSGFLLASLEDLLRFAVSMIDGSLIVDGLARMVDTRISRWTDHAPAPMAHTSSSYALGSFTGQWNEETVIRHGGQQLTSNCSLDFFPESRSGIVLLTNGADDATFMDLLGTCYRVVAGSDQDPTPIRRQSHRLERLQAAVGTFLDVDRGIVLEVSLDDGLWLHLGADMLALQYVGCDRWIASGAGGDIPIGIPWSEGISDHVVTWGNLHSRIDAIDARGGIPDEFCGRYADSFWDEAESRISVERHGPESSCRGRAFARWQVRSGRTVSSRHTGSWTTSPAAPPSSSAMRPGISR